MNEKIKAFLEISIIVFLFILSSYLIQENIGSLNSYIDHNHVSGALIYIIITIIAIVFAPVSTIFLIPIMSTMYGWFTAGVLSVIGWTIGSGIAFLIARKYGKNLVKKIISIKKIEEFEKKIRKENIFLSIVLLRMTIPVDVLSYTLGLLSNIKFRTYILATLIGVIPFAFILAYVGTLPFYFQLTAIIIVGTIITIFYLTKK